MKITRVWPKQDMLVQRALEIIQGFMIWVLLLSPFWAGKLFPEIMAQLLILLSVYWLYRALITTTGTSIGLYRAFRDMKLNWLEKCLKLAEFQLPDPEDLPVGQFLPKHLL